MQQTAVVVLVEVMGGWWEGVVILETRVGVLGEEGGGEGKGGLQLGEGRCIGRGEGQCEGKVDLLLGGSEGHWLVAYRDG